MHSVWQAVQGRKHLSAPIPRSAHIRPRLGPTWTQAAWLQPLQGAHGVLKGHPGYQLLSHQDWGQVPGVPGQGSKHDQHGQHGHH